MKQIKFSETDLVRTETPADCPKFPNCKLATFKPSNGENFKEGTEKIQKVLEINSNVDR